MTGVVTASQYTVITFIKAALATLLCTLHGNIDTARSHTASCSTALVNPTLCVITGTPSLDVTFISFQGHSNGLAAQVATRVEEKSTTKNTQYSNITSLSNNVK